MTAAELSGDSGWLVRRSAGRWRRKNRAAPVIVVVMTSLADRTIVALCAEHDLATATVSDLTEEQLTGPSGAAEWTLASVLSHLGSGAVITLAGLQSALGARQAPEAGFNESVWDVWNAM